ncbi:MAG: hypothetical protein IT323_10615 [Anaerolineae bacterium]|nr:hypothetical protein [Anaerolineae bacterium]
MNDRAPSWEDVAEQAEALELIDQVRLLEWLSAQIKASLLVEKKAPKRSLYGLNADLGPGPSAQDIDDVRREMLRGFPREDIA